MILYISNRFSICNNDISTISTNTRVSVVIIVRNEAFHIKKCIQSILANDQKNISSVIVVDDHSTDHTLKILSSFDSELITVLALKNFDRLEDYRHQFKKAGLHYALEHVMTDWVLTTDGDCTVGPYWINTVISHVEEQKLEVGTGLINIEGGKDLIKAFQNVEMKGTMAATMVGITGDKFYSANAANMVFKKKDYLKFLADDDSIYASGDDIFFAQWASQNHRKLGFVNHIKAIVLTPSLDKLSDLFSQRLRWATKTKSYKTWGLKILMIGLFVFHISTLLLPIVSLMFFPGYMAWTIFPLIMKCIVDYVLLSKVSKDIADPMRITIFPVLIVMHIFYLIVIGTSGLILNNYSWKGRKVT